MDAADLNGAGDWVVVVDGGPTSDRRPALAFGPFASDTEAEAWRRRSLQRWKDVNGWRTRIVAASEEGQPPLQAP